jgi:hypothetical protein
MINRLALALLLAALGAPGLAAAQIQAPAAGPASATRLNWPRTFAGQPDFEFSRADVVAERTRKAHEDNTGVPLLPTLNDLLEDIPLDPLGLEVATAGTTTVSGTAHENLASLAGKPEVGISASTLPDFAAPADIDLTEFRNSMAQALASYLRGWHPDLRQYDLGFLLRGLTLQSLMTSPRQMATINGRRYHVGDQLKATVTLTPSDQDLIAVLEAQLPPPGTVSPAQAKRYKEAYENMVGTLAAQRQKQPQLYQRSFVLPVTVRAIASRKVTLDFNGVTYDLAIPYAY